MHLYPVPVVDVATFWPRVEGWIADAVDHAGGWWSVDDIHTRLVCGNAGLWLVMDEVPVACVVTEVEDGPRYRTVVISICAGAGMESWLHLLPHIEWWAKSIDAKVIEVRGRKGWARALKGAGYSTRAVIIGKELQ